MNERRIVPKTPIPATNAKIIEAPHPQLEVDIGFAARLVGLDSTHLETILDEHIGEVPENITGEHLARVYSVTRPEGSLLCDRHFTSEEGANALEQFVDDLREPGQDDLFTDAVYHGDALEHLIEFPECEIQTVVTSPPYWGVRAYPEECAVEWMDGTEVPFGCEDTPEQYIRHTVEFFERMRPTLAEDATVFWNVGITYNTRTQLRGSSSERLEAMAGDDEQDWEDFEAKRLSSGHEYLKDKDLALVPERIAAALQRADWWVRSLIVWEKPNVMPEPVRDRPTTSHEYIIVAHPSTESKFDEERWKKASGVGGRQLDESENLPTVWEMTPAQGEYSHAAPFPVELPARCILCGSEEGDLVYDPFLGSGTTAVAAEELDREWVGSEVVQDYVRTIDGRVGDGADQRGQLTLKTEF